MRDEAGFTLVELLNVLLILGILMSISISSYSTLHARAEQRAAQANVRAILPAVSAWRNDNSTYAGMTVALLNSLYLDDSLDITYYDVGADARHGQLLRAVHLAVRRLHRQGALRRDDHRRARQRLHLILRALQRPPPSPRRRA